MTTTMGIDEIMGNTGMLQFNDSQRTDNCVWVATARLLGFRNVSDLEDKLRLPAPDGGSSYDQQQAFRVKLGEYNERVYGKYAVWTLLYGELLKTSDCVVVYERPNGTRHCVNRVGGEFLDFQGSDEGSDVSWDVQSGKIVWCWNFELARWNDCVD